MRTQLLNHPTSSQSEIEKRIISVDETNEALNEQVKSEIEKADEKSATRLIVHSVYEKRLETIQRDIHEVWAMTFEDSNMLNVKLIVGSRNARNAKLELVRTRPALSLLTSK
jgi:hypothetical protein